MEFAMSRLSLILGALVAVCLPALAAAAPPEEGRSRPDLITNAEWLRKPTGDDVARAYPQRALQAALSGRALLQCRVRQNGTLTRCIVMAESPTGSDFGATSLKLSSKFALKPAAEAEPSLEGRLVRIPMVWRLRDGAAVPAPSYQVGGGATLVTVLPAGQEAAGSIACATAAEPGRRCGLHPFEWVDSPTLDESAQAILRTHQASGLSQLNCLAGAEGALSDCKLAGDVPDAAREAMLAFVPKLKAPVAAEDGTPLSSGRVIIIFDWASLSRAAEVATIKY
jgi:TonB family protein